MKKNSVKDNISFKTIKTWKSLQENKENSFVIYSINQFIYAKVWVQEIWFSKEILMCAKTLQQNYS